MPVLTAQFVFEDLVRASFNGEFPAVEINPLTGFAHCQYRTKEGKKCAVGRFIPDEKYTGVLESFSPGKALDICGVKLEPALLHWFGAIQAVHDSVATELKEGVHINDRPFEYKPWSHTKFVQQLRQLSCFAECTMPEGIPE